MYKESRNTHGNNRNPYSRGSQDDNKNRHDNINRHDNNNRHDRYSEPKQVSKYTPHSRNMHYYFNVEYFDSTDKTGEGATPDKKSEALTKFAFYGRSEGARLKDELGDQLSAFKLYTAYPGLLEGIGNPRGLLEPDNETNNSASDASQIKCGFTFDYTTGVPFIPGSALKGLLRSYFPGSGNKKDSEKEEYIRVLFAESFEAHDRLPAEEATRKAENMNIEELENMIFGCAREDAVEGSEAEKNRNDIFLGAYPDTSTDKSLMDMDYITPHTGGLFKNPVPIKILKVRPNIGFDFCFILHDHIVNDLLISKEVLRDVFQKIILDMGAGAKTNTGYGRFLTARRSDEVKKVQPKAPSRPNYNPNFNSGFHSSFRSNGRG